MFFTGKRFYFFKTLAFLGLFLLLVNFSFAQTVELGPAKKIVLPSTKLGSPPAGWEDQAGKLAENQTDGASLKTASIFISDFSLTQKEIKSGDTVFGKFTAKNGSEFPLYNIKYSVSLVEVGRVVKPDFWPKGAPYSASLGAHTLAWRQISDEIIDLPKGGSLNKSISYTLPTSLLSGDYFLWITAYTRSGQAFTSQDIKISVKGTRVLTFDLSDAYYEQEHEGGVSYTYATDLIPYGSDASVKLTYDIKSTTPIDFEIKPHVVVRSQSPVGPVVSEADAKSFILKPKKESQSLAVTLPSIKKPGEYFGSVSFASRTSPQNKFASAALESRFAFIIKGDQADIESVYVESSKLNVQIKGPQYPGVDVGGVLVKLSATDIRTGQGVVSQEKKINLTGLDGANPAQFLVFDLAAVPQYPRFDLSIVKGGQVLDEYVFEPNGKISSSTEKSDKILSYIIMLLIAAAIIMFVRMYMKRRNAVGTILLLFGVALFSLFYVNSVEAVVLDRIPQTVFGTSAAWTTPLDGVAEAGDVLNFNFAVWSPRWGSPWGACNVPPWPVNTAAYAAITDVPWSGNWVFSGTRPNVNAMFPGGNNADLGPLFSNGSAGYNGNPFNCTTWIQGSAWGSKVVPDSGSKSSYLNKNVYLYVMFAAPNGWNMAHISLTITPLSYQISADPLTRTIANKKDEKAPYTITTLAGFKSIPPVSQPAIFDYLAGYPLPTVPYWDNPTFNNGYKPGDTINLSAGYASPGFGIGTNSCSRVSGSGASLAVAVLSDKELPGEESATLTVKNIREKFQNTNYRTLGVVNSSLQLGYNQDCTIWFQARVSGNKTIPTNAAVCNASGGLIPFNGNAYIYIIFAGDQGSFVGHQKIRVGPGMTPDPPAMSSEFNEPVRYSLLSGIPGLDPKFYTASFDVNPATAGSPYKQSTLTVTTKEATESVYACPPGCVDVGGKGAGTCFNFSDWSFCGGYTWQTFTVPPPTGTYKFKIRGTSEGALPGIKKDSAELSLVISGNSPPTAFDNLRLNGQAVCKSVPLAWDNAEREEGYRLNRTKTTINPGCSGPGCFTTQTQTFNLGQDEVTFTDNTVEENSFYTYRVEAYNSVGVSESNPLPIRTLVCSAEPDLVVSSGPVLNSGTLQAGNTVTFKGTIKNKGGKEAKSTDATPFNNRFYVDVGNDNVGPFTDITPFPTINSLNVDGTQEVTSENWTNIPQGTHRIVVCADEPNPKVDESNELNNCSPTSGSTGVITVAAPKPDLVISSGPSLNSGALLTGRTVTFKATVKNAGNAIAAGTFRTQFRIDLKSDGSMNTTLAPNPTLADLVINADGQVVSGTWPNIPVGTHRVEVCADAPSNAVDESDETNNCNAPGTGVIVVVNPPPPTITLTASPNPVGKNNPTTLTWDATDVAPSDPTPCTASSNPAGLWPGQPQKPATGVEPSGDLVQTTRFTLTCVGPGGQNSASKTVLVGVIEEPPPGF